MSAKENVKKLRKIVKKRCPTVSVRMGSGTVYGWAQISKGGEGFTKKEIQCLKSFGFKPGGNWLPIPPDKVRNFIRTQGKKTKKRERFYIG